MMVNDKEWEYRSDTWVNSTIESKLLKAERLVARLINDEVKAYALTGIEKNPGRNFHVVKKSG